MINLKQHILDRFKLERNFLLFVVPKKKSNTTKKVNNNNSKTIKNGCQICKKKFKEHELVHFDLVHGALLDLIKRKSTNLDLNGYICLEDLNTIRNKHISNLVRVEKGELGRIEKDLMSSLEEQELLSKNVDQEYVKELTIGERLSDKLAELGGSWHFLILFGVFILIWVGINSAYLVSSSFDPYPFILLNLLLSCLAAIQAPVIMMSQNRQEMKDRMRNEYDYKINLKAELEIRHLHEKLDQLLNHQWKRLIQIQQIQMDLIEEIRKKK